MAATQTITRATSRRFDWRRFGLLVQANLLMALRARDYVFWVSLFPIMLMLLFGFVWGSQETPGEMGDLSFNLFMVPGLVVLALMSSGLPGNAETMTVYRERGILRRIQTTPLPAWQFMLAHVASQVVILVVQFFLMIGVSMVAFNLSYDVWGVIAAVPAVILAAVTFMAFGQMVAALVRKTQTASAITMTLLFPLMFLGNLWQPVWALPDWLQAISKVLPTTMVVDIIRVPLLSGHQFNTTLPPLVSLLGVVVYLAGTVLISTRFFKWS